MSPKGSSAQADSVPTNGAYTSVGAIRFYYETYGAGSDNDPPLVLLHGGVGASEMFAGNLQLLATSRRVLAVHLHGHGRSGDDDRPLTWEAMADDLAALLSSIGVGTFELMGYSLGAGVALNIAFRHPPLVRRLVLVSQPFRRSGWFPEALAGFDAMSPAFGEFMAQSPLAQVYPGKDWGRLFGRLGDLLRRDYDWAEQVRALRCPALLIYADADAVRPEHVVEFYQLLGGGLHDAGLDGSGRSVNQLAIIPGATHYDVAATTRVGEIVAAFV